MNFQQFLNYDFLECWLLWMLTFLMLTSLNVDFFWMLTILNVDFLNLDFFETGILWILESRIILFLSSLNVDFFKILLLVTIFKIRNILMELFWMQFFHSALHSTANKLHTFHFKISFDCFCLLLLYSGRREELCVCEMAYSTTKQ